MLSGDVAELIVEEIDEAALLRCRPPSFSAWTPPAYPDPSSSLLSHSDSGTMRLLLPVWHGFKLPSHDLEGSELQFLTKRGRHASQQVSGIAEGEQSETGTACIAAIDGQRSEHGAGAQAQAGGHRRPRRSGPAGSELYGVHRGIKFSQVGKLFTASPYLRQELAEEPDSHDLAGERTPPEPVR